MKRLFDFKCECGKIKECLVTSDTKKVKCDCGKEAKRKVSMPRYFENTVGGSPSSKF